MSDPPERPRFCPFCGEPVGSFFGRHGIDGAAWCERCESWFRAERDDGGDAGEGGGNADTRSGR
jgi:hypothetical protein